MDETSGGIACTVREYQAASKYVRCWVMQASTAQGFKERSSRTRKNSSGRACGGGTLAREEAHRTHDMSCKELVQRSKYLSSRVADGLLRIPTTIVDSLDKAIRLRKETNSLVRALGQPDRDADLAHVHFIKALEEVRTLFGSVACGSSPKSRPPRSVTKTLYGRNIYEELDLHHVVEVDIDTNTGIDVVVEVEVQLAEAPKPNQDETAKEWENLGVACLFTTDPEKLAKGPFWANVHAVHEMIARQSDRVILHESIKHNMHKIDADLNAVDLNTLNQGLFQTIDMLHDLERCLDGYIERHGPGGEELEYRYAQAWLSKQVALQSRCIVAFEETVSEGDRNAGAGGVGPHLAFTACHKENDD